MPTTKGDVNMIDLWFAPGLFALKINSILLKSAEVFFRTLCEEIKKELEEEKKIPEDMANSSGGVVLPFDRKVI